MKHPAAYGIVDTINACAGRAILDQDPTPGRRSIDVLLLP
jgi:hypothetical protein